MLIQSRAGGFGAQWRQLSKLGRFTAITIGVFFLLAILWGTGTVDVDYVRNQFKNTAENHGDEPILQENNDTPIIDGVPNDQNDRPIPNGVIEEAQVKQSTEKESNNKPVAETQDAPLSIDSKPANAGSEKAHAQDDVPVVHSESARAESAQATSSVVPTPETKPGKAESASARTSPIAKGAALRVMYIGASITLGDPPQSAYRMQLRQWLTGLGNPVNCVGTNRFGMFKDNDVQAYPATPIQVLHEKAEKAVPEIQPNLVIINAGSSDCFQEDTLKSSGRAYEHTRSLVDFIFEASPRATVILSTLVTSTNPKFERCIKSVNAQIRRVAADVRRAGRHLHLSEQHYDQGLPGRVTPEFIKSDKMHPTFEGWAMMGEIYKQDLVDVDGQGWIVAPVDNGILPDGDLERDIQDGKVKPGDPKSSDPTSSDPTPSGSTPSGPTPSDLAPSATMPGDPVPQESKAGSSKLTIPHAQWLRWSRGR